MDCPGQAVGVAMLLPRLVLYCKFITGKLQRPAGPFSCTILARVNVDTGNEWLVIGVDLERPEF